jgi:hypothetical protein
VDQQHYQPMTKSPVTSRVTNGWGVSGMKSISDDYRSYVISVTRCWYVYTSKPAWFGEYSGDRYIGKRRWVSQHCDGKQKRYFYQRGDLDGMTVVTDSEKETDRIVHALLTARGYLGQHNTGWMRREYDWYLPSKYPQSIRCACCGMTCAESRRNRNDMYMRLKWGKGFERLMDDWAAFITARESVVCGCHYEPRQDVIADRIRTGEGLRYD